MAHGGYGKRRVAGRPSMSGARNTTRSSRGLGVRHNKESEKKAKVASIKNQIRSVERLLRKNLPVEVKDAQQKRLQDLKNQAELHQRAELERKMALRYRKVKFFERRKIERGIRRLEKLQRAALDNLGEEMDGQIADITQQLTHLKEDLEYVRFFPKTEKYVSLFMGNDDEVIAKKKKLREQIKANLAAAAASGVEPEETGSEDDGAMEVSDDDFFLAGSSSDDADADDEWTDKSSRPGDDRDDTSRELLPSSSKYTLGHKKRQHHRLSNLGLGSQIHGQRLQSKGGDHKNKKQKTIRVLMPPPSRPSSSNSGGLQVRSQPSSSKSSKMPRSGPSSSNTAGFVRIGSRPSSSNSSDILKATTTPTVGSSNSDAHQKRRRKRRPKKKK